MKKLLVLIFISLVFIPVVVAQPDKAQQKTAQPEKVQKNIEKYQKDLQQLEGHERLKAIDAITKTEMQNSPDTTLYYYKQGIELLKSFPDATIESSLIHNAAWAYIGKGDYDKAKQYANLCLTIAKTNNKRSGQRAAYTALGAIALYTGDTGTALTYFKQASAMSKLIGNKAEIALHNIGSIYLQLGDLNAALEYFIQSRDLSTANGKLKELATTESQIANLYVLMGNFDKAIPYYEKAITTHQTMNNGFYVAATKELLARALSMANRFSEAETTIQQAINLQLALSENVHLKYAFIISGEIYLAQDKNEEAIAAYSKALAAGKKVDSDDEIYQASDGLAKVYLNVKDYGKAIKYATVALAKAQLIQNNIAIARVEEVFSKIYAQHGEYQNAYQHLLSHTALNAENKKKEISDKNEQTENRFQSAKKEKQIELLTIDNQLQTLKISQKTAERNLWIMVFLLLMLIAVFILYRQNQKRKLSVEREKLMAELMNKKNQLLADVSHELRTPLSVLHLKVEALQHNLVKDVDASYEGLIVKISEINTLISDIYQLAQSDIGALEMNTSPNNCKNMLTTWSTELADIVEINGFKWHQTINIDNDLMIEVDVEKLKQVLCNLVDNSISYTDKPGEIGLSVVQLKNNLSIRIADSAPGVTHDNLSKIFESLFRVETSRSRATGGAGLGLAICQSIVEAHKGSIAASNSKHGGLAVTIKLPIIQR